MEMVIAQRPSAVVRRRQHQLDSSEAGGDSFFHGVCWISRLLGGLKEGEVGRALSHRAKTVCREGINVPDVNVSGNLTVACGSVLGPKIRGKASVGMLSTMLAQEDFREADIVE